MKTLSVNLANTSINFSTNFEKYFEYLSSYFEKIRGSGTGASDIEIRFHYGTESLGKLLKDLKGQDDYVEIGASTLVSDDSVIAIRKIERRWKFLYKVSSKDNRLVMDAYLQQKPIKEFFRYKLMGKSYDEWFFAITYYLLYYPLFWYLERFRQTHALHASALSLNGKCIVICGLEGVGKTSLALKFLQDKDSQFIADNLIFFDQQKVYPCYELIRMHAGDDNGLWEGKFEQVNTLNLLKGFFRPSFNIDEGGVAPNLVIFPEFRSQFSCEDISSDQAAHRALLLSHLPAELNNYVEFRNLMNLLNQDYNPWESMYDGLEKLLKSARCVRVGMKKEDGLDQNFQRLKETVFK